MFPPIIEIDTYLRHAGIVFIADAVKLGHYSFIPWLTVFLMTMEWLAVWYFVYLGFVIARWRRK